MKKFKILLLAVLTMVFSHNLFAQSKKLSGRSIAENNTIVVQNDLFGQAIEQNYNANTKAIVSLKYNKLNIPFSSTAGLSLSVPINLKCFDKSNLEVKNEDFILTLTYDEINVEGKDNASFVIEGDFYRTEVTVGQILPAQQGLLTNDIILESTIDFDRRTLFVCNEFPAAPQYLLDVLTNELTYNWPIYSGAVEYELEWLFISAETVEAQNNVSSIVTPSQKDFQQKATRIVTNKNEFTMSLPFGLGKVYYRYRPIGLRIDGKTKWTGTWSQLSNTIPFTVSEAFIENRDMTWVYNAAYSNKGRSSEQKTFVSPDGKVRQSIAKDKLNGNIIVAEQKYDFNGAPTISLLPGVHQGSSLAYNQNYTLDNTGNPYGKLNFATDEKVENLGADPINTLADDNNQLHNNYFSQNNAFVGDGKHDYVADAEGYGYSMAWIDNEGRLTKAGGAGSELKLGSGKEVHIFYGNVNEDELLTLFGNEVGFADHYTKSMTVDENGLSTVNYYNLSGQLIATGVAGDKPENLEAIEGQVEYVSEDLSTHNEILEKENKRVINYDLMVSSDDEHFFHYELTQEWYNNQCDASTDYHCVYDLSFSIDDNMGQVQMLKKPDGSLQSKLTYHITEASFAGGPFKIDFSAELKLGSYKVLKELVVNDDAFKVAYSNFQTNLEQGDLCIETEEHYINQELNAFANNFECGECEQSCAEFTDRYMTYNNTNLGNEITIETGLEELEMLYDLKDVNSYKYDAVNAVEWKETYDICRQEVCFDDLDDLEVPDLNCRGLEGAFLMDFMPGGQYFENRGLNDDAEYEGNPTWLKEKIEDFEQNYDFFTLVDKWKTNGGWNWKYYVIRQSGWLRGTKKTVRVDGGDFSGRSYERLVENFNPSWAKDMVKYHPEYCDVLICEETSSFANAINQLVRKTYPSALASGDGSSKKDKIDDYLRDWITSDLSNYNNSTFNLKETKYRGVKIENNNVKFTASNYSKYFNDLLINYPFATFEGITGPITLQRAAEEQAKLSLNIDFFDVNDDLHVEYYYRFAKGYIQAIRNVYLAYIKIALKRKLSNETHCSDCWNNVQSKLSTDQNDYLAGNPYTYETEIDGQTKTFAVSFPDFSLYTVKNAIDVINESRGGTYDAATDILDISNYDFSTEFASMNQGLQETQDQYSNIGTAAPQGCDVTFEIDVNEFANKFPNGGSFVGYLIHNSEYDNLATLSAGHDFYYVSDATKNLNLTDKYVPFTFSTVSDLETNLIEAFTFNNYLEKESSLNGIITFKVSNSAPSNFDVNNFATIYFEGQGGPGPNTSNKGHIVRANSCCSRKKIGRINIGQVFDVVCMEHFADKDYEFALGVGDIQDDYSRIKDYSTTNDGFNSNFNLTTPLSATFFDEIYTEAKITQFGEDVDLNSMGSIIAPEDWNASIHGVCGFTRTYKEFFVSRFFQELNNNKKEGVHLNLKGDYIEIEVEYEVGYYVNGDFSLVDRSPSNTIMTNAIISCFGPFSPSANFEVEVAGECEPTCDGDKYFEIDFNKLNFCGNPENSYVSIALLNKKFTNRFSSFCDNGGSQIIDGSDLGSFPPSEMARLEHGVFQTQFPNGVYNAQATFESFMTGFTDNEIFEIVVVGNNIVRLEPFNQSLINEFPYLSYENSGSNADNDLIIKAKSCCEYSYQAQFSLSEGSSNKVRTFSPAYLRTSGFHLGFGNQAVLNKGFDYNDPNDENAITAKVIASIPAADFVAAFDEATQYENYNPNEILVNMINNLPNFSAKLNASGDLLTVGFTQSFGDFYGDSYQLMAVSGERASTAVVLNNIAKSARLVQIEEACEVEEPENCFCEELSDLREGLFASQFNITTPGDYNTHATEEAAIVGYIADYYNSKYGPQFVHPSTNTYGYRLTGEIVATWLQNCGTYNYPESEIFDSEGVLTDYTVTVPTEMNCYGCNNKWEQEDVAVELGLSKRAREIATELDDFKKAYYEQCLKGDRIQEKFTVSFTKKDYDYTLFYYNEVGDLVRTVSPEGFRKLNQPELKQAKEYLHGEVSDGIAIQEQHITEQIHSFAYNTLGQVRKSNSPDMGSSEVIYDRYGRVILSQNEEQAQAADGLVEYNFTQYDALSRPYRMGELSVNPILATNNQLSSSAKQLAAGNVDFDYWFAMADQHEISKFYYGHDFWETGISDDLYGSLNGEEFELVTELNTRLRPVAMLYYPLHENQAGDNYLTGNYYVYNNVGQVVAHVQENTPLQGTEQHYIKTAYEFDPYTSEMQKIKYQEGKEDQFFTKMEYDGLGRLRKSYTSTDDVLYKLEATTEFYNHGALSRAELGHHAIQGMDFVYRLNGQLKSMNSATLSAERDMGHDGYSSSNTQKSVNNYFARDVAGFSLGYFNNDYKSIGNIAAQNQTYANTSNHPQVKQLYNGMITSSTTAIYTDKDVNNDGVDEFVKDPQMGIYQYDMKYRLTEAAYLKSNEVTSSNTWSNAYFDGNGTGVQKQQSSYYTHFSYDKNTNITGLTRNGLHNGATAAMDQLTYKHHYRDVDGDGTADLVGNKLYHVTDAAGGGTAGDYKDNSNPTYLGNDGTNIEADIAQINGANNFSYNKIGAVVKNEAEGYTIQWNSRRKVKSITRINNTIPGANIEFLYNALGRQIGKIVKPRDLNASTNTFQTVPSAEWKHEYYGFDAAGNIMATYEHKINMSQSTRGNNYTRAELKVNDCEGITGGAGPIVYVSITTPNNTTEQFSSNYSDGLANNVAANLADNINSNSLYFLASVSENCDNCITITSRDLGGEFNNSQIDFSNNNYVNTPITIVKPFSGGGEHPQSGEVVQSTLKDQSILAGGRIGVRKINQLLTGELAATNYHNTYVGKRYYEIKNWLGSVISVVKDIKFKVDESIVQQESFNSGTYVSNQWSAVGATFSIPNPTASNPKLQVNTSGLWHGAQYDIQTQAGEDYILEFEITGVDAGEHLYVEARNNGDPENKVIAVHSKPKNGKYTMHFTASGSVVRVKFFTNSVNPTEFYLDDIVVKKGGHYEAVVAQSSDYYPYGMRMKGRGRTGKYAYGYQGSRSVDEVEGEGNTYTTEFRQLDSRLGIWRSPDPVFQPWQSPYNSMDGNPINLTDVSGLSIYTGGRGEGGKSGVRYEKTQSTKKESRADDSNKNDDGYTSDGSYYKQLPNGKVYRYTPVDFETCEEKKENQTNTSNKEQKQTEKKEPEPSKLGKPNSGDINNKEESSDKSGSKGSNKTRTVEESLKKAVEKVPDGATDVADGLTIAGNTFEIAGNEVLKKQIIKSKQNATMLQKIFRSDALIKEVLKNSDDATQFVNSVRAAGKKLGFVLGTAVTAYDIAKAFSDPTDENVGNAIVSTAITAVGLACVPCGMVLGFADAAFGDSYHAAVGELAKDVVAPIGDAMDAIADWWNDEDEAEDESEDCILCW